VWCVLEVVWNETLEFALSKLCPDMVAAPNADDSGGSIFAYFALTLLWPALSAAAFLIASAAAALAASASAANSLALN